MPPPPSQRVAPLRTSVFAILQKRLEGYTGPRYPLHIGDHCLDPAEGARFPAVDVARAGPPYRYGHPNGEAVLRDALAARLRARHGLSYVTADHIQVTTGATHAIACIMTALLEPGDEVLVLAPFWPLVRGIIHCAAGVPVEVPFYQRLLDDPQADPRALIEPFITPRTRILYVISPNNPNGLVLTRSQAEALAALAREKDLWVVADEAYESYAFAREHVSLASLPGMAERTLSVYTFSKTFALAGIRVGYLAAPPVAMDPIRKVATHSVYNTAQICQAAALHALDHGDAFVARARATYGAAAEIVRTRLDAPFHPAQGGAYVFLDLRPWGPDAMTVLEPAADRGVTLAPGVIFGSGYEGFARLCYTAVDGARLATSLDVLSEVLASLPRVHP